MTAISGILRAIRAPSDLSCLITFLVTIIVMGTSTFLVGLLPTYANIGWLAPVLLVMLRLLQGLAVGGEYGGATTYVAEHARPGERGYATSWIQATGTVGLARALVIIILCRESIDAQAFSEWGSRIPFVVSVILLVFLVYIRLRPNESPIFQKMKEEGKGSKAPLTESFLHYPNNKYVLLALRNPTGAYGWLGQDHENTMKIYILQAVIVAWRGAGQR